MSRPRELTVFQDATRDRIPWDRRAQMILSQFDSVEKLAWRKAFGADIDLFGRLVKDVLKLDQAQPGRPGPRPALDYGQGVARLKQYMGSDYAIEPFRDAFKHLADGRSIRALARKTGLSKNHVHRLTTGEIEPDAYAMTQIAKAFGKNASYFAEWRAMWIANAIVGRLIDNPESSISLYRKMKD
jgi:transcriptional regulator with XRE-family HTH domain